MIRGTLEYHLAERIINLEDALKIANDNARKNGQLGVLGDRVHQPSFREASRYHARVRKLLKEESENF